MRLKLFEFVDEATAHLQLNLPTYQYIQGILKGIFNDVVREKGDLMVRISSRIKGKESLKEKFIRNKYYLLYEDVEQAMENLPDLIGLTLECRFISDEQELYQWLFQYFKKANTEFYQYIHNDDIYLNLTIPQPQYQRNGFTIYRIDGYVEFNLQRINFELQIKSLIHSFWSEVEHQVVYKNKQFVVYDDFMKNILATIRDNLDVVDRQLQTVYKQLSNEIQTDGEIGLTEKGFKIFMAKAINDLVSSKMHSSIGFTTDFRKRSSVLSQYIYIKDFIRSPNPQLRMVEYFEHFNLLKISDLDLTQPLHMDAPFSHHDAFCDIVGKHWQSMLNTDYEWHIFFTMLFTISQGDYRHEFTEFLEVIKSLIVPPSWYKQRFSKFEKNEQIVIQQELMVTLANSIVQQSSISMIHEEKLFLLLENFHDFIEQTESRLPSFIHYRLEYDDIHYQLECIIKSIFK